MDPLIATGFGFGDIARQSPFCRVPRGRHRFIHDAQPARTVVAGPQFHSLPYL